MDKIFRRSSLVEGCKAKPKNRKRSVILNFRVSPEEKALIEKRIELSGLPKAEFFIQSCINQRITTYGNIKTFAVIKDEIKRIDEHMQDIKSVDEMDEITLMSLKTIVEMLDSIFGDEE